jgi:hypothetical protein
MGELGVWWFVMYICSGTVCDINPAVPPRLEYVGAWCKQDVERWTDLFARLGAPDRRAACIPDVLALPKSPTPYQVSDIDLATRAIGAIGNIRLGTPAPR